MTVIICNDICKNLSDYSEYIFRDNLLFSFIGGSHATGKQKIDSDVDIFIVINDSDVQSESDFAKYFILEHERNNLKFDHIGQILTISTLDNLIATAEKIIEHCNIILDTACYHADCILSIFRKADIVLKMLELQKIFPKGNLDTLSKYQDAAYQYFRSYNYKRIQLAKKLLFIPNSDTFKNKRDLIYKISTTNKYDCSPIGINLDHWFDINISDKISSIARMSNSYKKAPLNIYECPLSYIDKSSTSYSIFELQCLSHYYKITEVNNEL